MAQIDIKNCIVKFKDGSSNELIIKVAEGSINYTVFKDRIYSKDRGTLDKVFDDDEKPMQVSISLIWEFLKASSGDPPTPLDVLYNEGEASSWVSTSADPCESFAINIEVIHTPPCSGVQSETIVFPDFRYESVDPKMKDGVINISGKCNAVKPVITRT